MKAVILAAGEGKRMRPLTYNRPKVMLTLANKPILEHLMLELRDTGITEFFFVVGYFADSVRQYFGKGEKWGITIDYLIQRQQMGTAHALKRVESVVDGHFLLANGDIIVKSEAIGHLQDIGDTAMSVIEVKDPSGLGVVEIENNRVIRIHEKKVPPPSNLVNAGLYLLTPDIFTAVNQIAPSPRGEFELTDALQYLINEGHNVSCNLIDEWFNLTYPWDLLDVNAVLLSALPQRNQGTIDDYVTIKGNVSIGNCTEVKAGSYIEGPAIIGDNCRIGPCCYIRPCTAIGDNCHIGSMVEVKNSIIMNNTNVPHHNYIGDSIIGERCNLGAGTKVANLRFDKANVKAMDIDTKHKKFGAVIGDFVQTGINSSINAGAIIGNGSHIAPGAFVSGTILTETKVF